jgi:hypothetical protein
MRLIWMVYKPPNASSHPLDQVLNVTDIKKLAALLLRCPSLAHLSLRGVLIS